MRRGPKQLLGGHYMLGYLGDNGVDEHTCAAYLNN
jgi:hypothetical protein